MKQLIYGLVSILIISLFAACNTNVLPKPKAYLSLKYPIATYQKITTNCPYEFELSNNAKFIKKNKCWAILEYPKLKATLYITYRKNKKNLVNILKEVEKYTFKHAKKADKITDIAYVNYDKKVFAKLYNVEGNVASNLQFSATDSVKNVLAGALYFYVKPNYDSLLPSIKYIEKDVTHLIETLRWKNETK